MFRILFLFFVFSLFTFGCQNNSETKTLQIVDNNADLMVNVTVKSNPATMLQKNHLYITLNNKDGSKVDGAKVKVSLIMPQMNHADLSYTAYPKEEGVYYVEIIPIMQGTWVANVTAETEKKYLEAKYTFEAKR